MSSLELGIAMRALKRKECVVGCKMVADEAVRDNMTG